jgi:hypothetical protein
MMLIVQITLHVGLERFFKSPEAFAGLIRRQVVLFMHILELEDRAAALRNAAESSS